MADIIDDANDTAETFLRAALSKHQHSAKVTTEGVGLCLCCGADLPDDRRWCNPECRNLWQDEQTRRERK